MLNSQGDDSRGEGLGDHLGVHTEGTVFGAGAGRRTAGGLGGSPGVGFPRQDETQTQEWQAYQPCPSLSELRHPWAGGKRSHFLKFLLSGFCERWWSRLPTTPAVLIMLSAALREPAWGRGEGCERKRREGGGGEWGESCVSSVGVGALQLPWICAIFLPEPLPECTLQEWRSRLLSSLY